MMMMIITLIMMIIIINFIYITPFIAQFKTQQQRAFQVRMNHKTDKIIHVGE